MATKRTSLEGINKDLQIEQHGPKTWALYRKGKKEGSWDWIGTVRQYNKEFKVMSIHNHKWVDKVLTSLVEAANYLGDKK